jgi:predicted PurR-regulated permease PerM
MSDTRKQEEMLDEQLQMLDGFAHPLPSEELVSQIASSTASRLRRDRRTRMIVRLVSPLAAAAVIVLAFTMWFHFYTQGATSLPQQYAQTQSRQTPEMAELLADDFGLSSDLDTESTEDQTAAEAYQQQLEELAVSLVL